MNKTCGRVVFCIGAAMWPLAETSPGLQESLQRKLAGYGSEVERVVKIQNAKKGPVDYDMMADINVLVKYFSPDSEALKSAAKMKLIDNGAREDQVYTLACSVWAELRTSKKTKVPPGKTLTPQLLKAALDNSVYVNFTSDTGGAEVYIDGLKRPGMTNCDAFLSRNQTYEVTFKKNKQQDQQSFTPMTNGDTCNGKI
jgi:hypothetical protein